MTASNPFTTDAAGEAEDLALVDRARDGSREALERLIERHQAWIYNLVLRMIYHPQDAEDATQEVLLKVVTRLSTFQGRSSVRTWIYRVACNHVLNMKRRRFEPATLSFDDYGRGLDGTPDLDLADPRALPADVHLLVDEARIGCTSGMLLCLDREQRLVYILGGIFGVADTLGAELLGITREAFRQKLARARRDLHNFMHGKCGLVNAANPCRCARKTQGFINAGLLDPQHLLFATAHVQRVRDAAPAALEGLDALDAAYGGIHRDHPFQSGPDLAGSLRALLGRPELKSILDPR